MKLLAPDQLLKGNTYGEVEECFDWNPRKCEKRGKASAEFLHLPCYQNTRRLSHSRSTMTLNASQTFQLTWGRAEQIARKNLPAYRSQCTATAPPSWTKCLTSRIQHHHLSSGCVCLEKPSLDGHIQLFLKVKKSAYKPCSRTHSNIHPPNPSNQRKGSQPPYIFSYSSERTYDSCSMSPTMVGIYLHNLHYLRHTLTLQTNHSTVQTKPFTYLFSPQSYNHETRSTPRSQLRRLHHSGPHLLHDPRNGRHRPHPRTRRR